MKRILAIALALALCIAAAGCGKEDAPPRREEAPPATRQTQPEPTEDPLRFDPFDPILVTDTEDYTIVVDSASFPREDTCHIYATYTNKTADTTLCFRLKGAGYNGVWGTGGRDENLAPGETRQVLIENSFYRMELVDMGPITDLSLEFIVAPADTLGLWEDAPIVHLYPRGADQAEKHVFTPGPEDVVLFDNEYGRAVIVGYTSWWPVDFPLSVMFYFENRTDREVVFMSEPLVNGGMADVYTTGHFVCAGYATLGEISWNWAQLEGSGLSDPENQVLTLHFPMELVYRGDYDNILAQGSVTLYRGESLRDFAPEE